MHSRFSTNTFPSWELAHPYRVICHNGEINTVMGNINWMRARESELASELFGRDLPKILPIVRPGGSDSATFDNVLELLMLAGRSLPHAVMMMIPEAYKGREDLSDDLRGLLRLPLLPDGAVGRPGRRRLHQRAVVGATLDRNGLRPGRWVLTTDGHVVLGSEAGMLGSEQGTLGIPPEQVQRLGRLQPGTLFLVDLQQGRIIDDGEIKHQIATQQPYGGWYAKNSVHFSQLPKSDQVTLSDQPLRTRQRAFGYTQEDLRVLLEPMARDAAEPIGSMGNDLSLAVLSDQAPPLFSYFKQLFAQVTNPPIDPIREEIVMSLASSVGPRAQPARRVARARAPARARPADPPQPRARDAAPRRARRVRRPHDRHHLAGAPRGPTGCARRSRASATRPTTPSRPDKNIIILSDRRLNRERAPIPSLLAVAAVHHHLVREGTRLRAGLIVESGEPREVHHFATLIAYGASADQPVRAARDARRARLRGPHHQARPRRRAGAPSRRRRRRRTSSRRSARACSRRSPRWGSRRSSPTAARRSSRPSASTGRSSTCTSAGPRRASAASASRSSPPRRSSATPAPTRCPHDPLLPVGGVYAWRRDGEHHMWNPETIALVQHAVRAANGDVAAALGGDAEALLTVRGGPAYEKYREYARQVNEDAARKATLRGLLQLRDDCTPIPLEEVESAAEIVRRFCTGAMSLGSISREAHETLAIAMNRLGGRSNTGEGGEDPVRFTPDANGDSRRSAIKQVASGRFGVTINYLVNADELQIKMAQGAKPGEGGQLPGHKVDEYIGSIRHTTPGVGLISPPPHHDIYSIEDLKQLIYDLRCGNPQAQVSVKLVSEVGVGTVAAGVSKANADRVLIAGHDGGTGRVAAVLDPGRRACRGRSASRRPSRRCLLNDLRSRIIVQTDGQLKTGRDVMIAALLGADEMGFSTAPLIATGCIMMRACHLNTCPVGIATQDPELRKRFKGTPEHVVNFFFFVAEEVRELLASLGLRSLDEATGRVDLLRADAAIEHWKARGVDLTHVLREVPVPEGAVAAPRAAAARGARRRARLGARRARAPRARARRGVST